MMSPYSLLFTNPVRDYTIVEGKYYDPATDILSKLFPEGYKAPDKLSAAMAYEVNAWLRRCMDVRAEAFASIPYTIRRRVGGEIIYDSESFDPLPDSLLWLQDLEDLLRLSELSLILSARAYWRPLMVRGRRTGIQWIDPNTMQERYGNDGQIIGYHREYTDQNGNHIVREWPADEIVAFYQRDPFTEVGPGSSIGNSLRVNADVLYSLNTMLDSYLDRGLLPASVIALPANTSRAERSRIQRIWDAMFRGKTNAGRQLVINADAFKIEQLGDGLADISTPELVREQREAIAAALGIPMSHLLPDAANRATSFQDDENLYTKALIPQAKRRQTDINRQLFTPDGLFFRYEFKRIEALQRANLEKAKSAFAITGMPILTRNEAREAIGHKTVDGGDVFADEVEAARAMEQATMQAEAAQQQAEQVQQQAEQNGRMSGRAFIELENWKRKRERTGSIEWVREHIPEHIYDTIKSRLDRGDEKAFEPPYIEY